MIKSVDHLELVAYAATWSYMFIHIILHKMLLYSLYVNLFVYKCPLATENR